MALGRIRGHGAPPAGPHPRRGRDAHGRLGARPRADPAADRGGRPSRHVAGRYAPRFAGRRPARDGNPPPAAATTHPSRDDRFRRDGTRPAGPGWSGAGRPDRPRDPRCSGRSRGELVERRARTARRGVARAPRRHRVGERRPRPPRLMRVPDRLRLVAQQIASPDSRVVGGCLCVAGLALVWLPTLWTGALGLELVAAAFWVWARAASDRDEQLPRWTWLRRPALALWLAAAAQAAQAEAVSHGMLPAKLATMLVWAQALGVVWAGLELLAALPLARPFSDRSGPLLAVGPWLPALLPSTGFVILWRHVEHWTAVPEVRRVALFLLILTAVLATLRAFGRGRWVASLRWLIVADCVFASMLVALAVVPHEVSLLLWLGACGGRAEPQQQDRKS